jgi:hypothetical protein
MATHSGHFRASAHKNEARRVAGLRVAFHFDRSDIPLLARSDIPIAKAFCLTAPSVRLSRRPMSRAGVF